MAGRLGFGVAVTCAAVTCAIAVVLVGRRARSRRGWRRAVEVLREFEEGCATPAGRLRQVVDAMAVEMHAGLASDGGSKLKMLLTFVDALPTGWDPRIPWNENGTYYALDLGGTNFKVLRVQLGSKGSMILSHRTDEHTIPQNLLTSTSEDLFDFIAMTLNHFIEEEDDGSEKRPNKRKEIGFTFSFPVRHTSVSSGTLIKWTKGFTIEDAVGKDVVQCLEEAMTRSGHDVRVAALVNDTVGTLALSHYHDVDTVAAVIIGTGTNACYIERTDAIIKCQGLLTNSGGMVVNMEWGNFWSSHLPRTTYDIALDDESPNRNEQGFEKLISGMYLGEIGRKVLYRMAQESDVFGDAIHHLSVPFILRTTSMAAMLEDESADLEIVGKTMCENLQISDVPLKARRLIVRVCFVVIRRAARLVAAGIVGILKKIGRDGSGGVLSGRARGKTRRSVVVIEGDLYSNYSVFREYLNEAVAEILGEEAAQNVIIRVSEDGSGKGAALLAACHSSDR